jgi:ABC-type sugar transport systems, permease components
MFDRYPAVQTAGYLNLKFKGEISLIQKSGHEKGYGLISKAMNNENVFSYIAVTPVILALVIFMAIPIVNVVYHSFTLWDGLQVRLIGFDNYINMLTNSDFWYILSNNLLYLIAVPVIILLSLVVAVLIYEELPGWKFFRSVFFLPYVLSAVVVGYLFRSIFAYSGPINKILNAIGLNGLVIDWLSSRGTAIAVIILAVAWTQFGYGMLVYLAGMSSISPSVFEASKIDGANWWQRFVHVILPMLIRTTEFLVILNTIFAFTSLFDYIYTITRGGPGYDTMPINYWIYMKAFRSNEMGFACALAIVLFVILLVVALIQRKVVNRADDWGE